MSVSCLRSRCGLAKVRTRRASGKSKLVRFERVERGGAPEIVGVPFPHATAHERSRTRCAADKSRGSM